MNGIMWLKRDVGAIGIGKLSVYPTIDKTNSLITSDLMLNVLPEHLLGQTQTYLSLVGLLSFFFVFCKKIYVKMYAEIYMKNLFKGKFF